MTISDLDDSLMTRTTQASYAVQLAIGWTNYRQAATMLVLFITAEIPDVLNYWLPDVLKLDSNSFISMMAAWMIFWANGMIVQLLSADRKWQSQDVLPLESWFVYSLSTRPLRIAWVGIVVLFLPPIAIRYALAREWLAFYTHLDSMFMMFAIYLCGVRPLPKGPTKVQQFIEAFRAGLRVPVKVRN